MAARRGAGEMVVTDHEKMEWSRLAQDAYAKGHSTAGHRFSAAAARVPRGGVLPTAEYDALMQDYRAWLIDGKFPGASRNTPLVIFNPGTRRGRRNPSDVTRDTVISRHVQAIAYVHKRDGKCYVHGFGDAELVEKKLNKGILDLSELNDRTNVEATLHGDGTVTLRGTHGQSLHALFED